MMTWGTSILGNLHMVAEICHGLSNDCHGDIDCNYRYDSWVRFENHENISNLCQFEYIPNLWQFIGNILV